MSRTLLHERRRGFMNHTAEEKKGKKKEKAERETAELQRATPSEARVRKKKHLVIYLRLETTGKRTIKEKLQTFFSRAADLTR